VTRKIASIALERGATRSKILPAAAIHPNVESIQLLKASLCTNEAAAQISRKT
jgi:hypothetical protein